MRAEVKYFEWDDVDTATTPLSEQTVGLLFAAGPLRGPGEETFQLTVCTPEALATAVARDGVVIGRHFIFVAAIVTERVEETIRDRLRRLDADSWPELTEKIGRIGLWEFEDYTDSTTQVSNHAAGSERPAKRLSPRFGMNGRRRR